MMFSDPRLVVSQTVQMHQQLHVARQSLRGILDHRVIWGEEYAQSQTVLHLADLLKGILSLTIDARDVYLDSMLEVKRRCRCAILTAF
jgi:hypothetical protein